jgi:hypothetical protein
LEKLNGLFVAEKFGDWKESVMEGGSAALLADAAPPPSIDVQTLLEEV